MPSKKNKSNGKRAKEKKGQGAAAAENKEEDKLDKLQPLLEVCRLKTDWNEDLFKQPPPKDDCPICFLRFPLNFHDKDGILYKAAVWYPCCGKEVCLGCVSAHDESIEKEGGKHSCPFCRTFYEKSDTEFRRRVNNRAKRDDPDAYLCSPSVKLIHFDCEKTLRAWKDSADEMESEQRSKALRERSNGRSKLRYK